LLLVLGSSRVSEQEKRVNWIGAKKRT